MFRQRDHLSALLKQSCRNSDKPFLQTRLRQRSRPFGGEEKSCHKVFLPISIGVRLRPISRSHEVMKYGANEMSDPTPYEPSYTVRVLRSRTHLACHALRSLEGGQRKARRTDVRAMA